MLSKYVKGICFSGNCEGVQEISFSVVGNDLVGDENEPLSTQVMCMGCRSGVCIPGTKLLDGEE